MTDKEKFYMSIASGLCANHEFYHNCKAKHLDYASEILRTAAEITSKAFDTQKLQ